MSIALTPIHKSGPSNFLKIADAYLLQIRCIIYFRVSLIHGCTIRLKKTIKLMNPMQVFVNAIQLSIVNVCIPSNLFIRIKGHVSNLTTVSRIFPP